MEYEIRSLALDDGLCRSCQRTAGADPLAARVFGKSWLEIWSAQFTLHLVLLIVSLLLRGADELKYPLVCYATVIVVYSGLQIALRRRRGTEVSNPQRLLVGVLVFWGALLTVILFNIVWRLKDELGWEPLTP